MRVEIESLEQMRTVAEVLAGHLQAGDLLILTGNLGAGKTTFTQSLGAALDVAGRITSPTFIIAREHPSRAGGPALVHVDAYRLADGEELEDLDLDSELDESITVVEWGAGMAEQLSSDYLEITIAPVQSDEPSDAAAGGSGTQRQTDAQTDGEAADDAEDEEAEDERRTVDLTGHGTSWAERLPRLHAAITAVEGMTTGGERP
ncbi:tRNA (adenosine(37)-N6)-threonylcarbamoyltransferase complex ATPase subunit type 1 TsaE [Brevibacterium renqingii]|uniref:tRNA (adenosine(37)-N6)-threonylcarbamoyltransferase complex ATPase subunit type 1 TsaE n=1 Tax=Brevibacterium renqingii TaxID=2776916 RepID=UPI001ADF723F|nr:tRNA (adenosine(37)-N6)-threonylcarbamoyltransferase complex ATPase subunit type 1 TsaE [Brevibacterium renqingii]